MYTLCTTRLFVSVYYIDTNKCVVLMVPCGTTGTTAKRECFMHIPVKNKKVLYFISDTTQPKLNLHINSIFFQTQPRLSIHSQPLYTIPPNYRFSFYPQAARILNSSSALCHKTLFFFLLLIWPRQVRIWGSERYLNKYILIIKKEPNVVLIVSYAYGEGIRIELRLFHN